MKANKRRRGWLDLFENHPVPAGVSRQQARAYAEILDDALHDQWNLGRNLIQLWAAQGNDMLLLVIPHYRLEEFATEEQRIEHVLTGPKLTTPSQLREAASLFGTDIMRIELPFVPGEGLGSELVSEMIHRYSITLVKDRAIALIDIAGFSLLTPLEQVTQLNSLSYSVNSAQQKLMERSINIQFSRSSTGDGFYIWNRTRDSKANIDLFDLLQIILADNRIAQQKARGKTVPVLKTCFNIGPHYEYYQAVGLNPTTYSYIVGDSSIELARMIERCLPNQILIRRFETGASGGKGRRTDTAGFVDEVEASELKLRGAELSGDRVVSAHCQLTGSTDQGKPRCYRITDKHGLSREVYNVRIDLGMTDGSSLALGLSPAELADFGDSALTA